MHDMKVDNSATRTTAGIATRTATLGRSDMSIYTNDSIVNILETGIKERHCLEARFRNLCRAIVCLGGEPRFGGSPSTVLRGPHGDVTPRRDGSWSGNPSHRLTSVNRKKRSGGASISSIPSCGETRCASVREALIKDHSPFREALAEAKVQLAAAREDGLPSSGTVNAREIDDSYTNKSINSGVKQVVPTWRAHISVQDESAKVSVMYQEENEHQSDEGARDRSLTSSSRQSITTPEGHEDGHRSNVAGTVHFSRPEKKKSFPIGGASDRARKTRLQHGARPCEQQSAPASPGRSSSTVAEDKQRAHPNNSRDARSAKPAEPEGKRIGRRTSSPRRARTLSIKAKRGKHFNVHLKTRDGSDSESKGTDESTLKYTTTGVSSRRTARHWTDIPLPGGSVGTAATRTVAGSGMASTGRGASKRVRKSPSDAHTLYSSAISDRCDTEGRTRSSTTLDKERLRNRKQQQQRETRIGEGGTERGERPEDASEVERKGGGGRAFRVREQRRVRNEKTNRNDRLNSNFALEGSGEEVGGGVGEEVEEEEENECDTAEEEWKYYSGGVGNRQYHERMRAEELGEEEDGEDEEEDQRRWRSRGRVLWSTHAEPAARAVSDAPHNPRASGGTKLRPQTSRPYHGLYARSLEANGIEPASFRMSRNRCRCGGDHASLDHAIYGGHVCACTQIDNSLLRRGIRGGDHLAAERTRAPTDGLPDRLEVGRILNSLNRRAELLRTLPPTPLRAKATWMENPGDPEYRLRESWDGLLSSFFGATSSDSSALPVGRAERRFANIASISGKTRIKASPARATTLLAAADAWSAPYEARASKGADAGKEDVWCTRGREAAGADTSSVAVDMPWARKSTRSPPVCVRTRRSEDGRHSRGNATSGGGGCSANAAYYDAFDTARSHAESPCRRDVTPSVGAAARFVGRYSVN